MIYINLLPTKNKLKKEVFIIHMVALAVLIVVSVISYFVVLDASINKKIAHEDQYISRLNTQINSLQSVIKQVEDYKKQKAELERKIGTIKKLNAGRTGPVKFMEAFSDLLPEKLYIATFKEDGKNLSLDGFAADGPTVEEFIDRLQESPYFSGVVLESVARVSDQGKDWQKFVVKCSVTYTPGA